MHWVVFLINHAHPKQSNHLTTAHYPVVMMLHPWIYLHIGLNRFGTYLVMLAVENEPILVHRLKREDVIGNEMFG